MMKKSWLILGLMLIFVCGGVSARTIKSGFWKFTLQMAQANVPFIVELKYKNKQLIGVLHNGLETIPLKNTSTKEDVFNFPLSNYEISMELNVQSETALSGYLIRHNKNPVVKTPLAALHGTDERFKTDLPKAEIDLNGKWGLELADEKEVKSPGIGNFVQNEQKFTGSILTPTGDYRYLEGYVSGNTFEAASFDGVYNYVFRGTVKDGKMEASILSNSVTKITGEKNSNAELPDAYKQTEIKELKFIFPDLKGQNVNLKHPKFKNKPVIVQIYGSWCPNCMDEMNFLIPWYRENNKKGIELIALAFERSLSIDDARKQLLKVQKKQKVPYVILQAGSTSEDKPADKLPGLKNFISFPTLIFLNKKHEVVKVHAGFNGPSTGEFFEKWKTDFNQTVKELLK